MGIEKIIERKSVYIAKVTIPSNASIYIETNKFKADQFILDLGNKVLIENFYIWGNEALCKLAVIKDGYNLEFVIIQTVSKNGLSLQWIKDQTDEICKIAVSQDWRALQFVKDQTDEICKLAINQNSLVLKFVKDPTDEIRKLVVSLLTMFSPKPNVPYKLLFQEMNNNIVVES